MGKAGGWRRETRAGGSAAGHRRAWGHRLSEPLSVLPAMPLPVPRLLRHAGESCSVNATSLLCGALLSSEDLPSVHRLRPCGASTPSFKRMSLERLFFAFSSTVVLARPQGLASSEW